MKQIIIVSIILLITSCANGPKEIDFGNDKCEFCTMMITDKPYAAEVITKKGKVYKFDSSECMLSYIYENSDTEFGTYLTATMDKPGELQDATQCSFLISPNLPSPMGANITAFSSVSLAIDGQREFTGDIYNFHQLKSGAHDGHHTH